jgi:CD109 antigen
MNTTSLEYVHKSHSVFIQTDKAVYKPGHKVQFRAIVLDAHLKPSVTGALDVYIAVSNSACKKCLLKISLKKS